MIPTRRLALLFAAGVPFAVLAWWWAWRWPALWIPVAAADALIGLAFIWDARGASARRAVRVRREPAGFLAAGRRAELAVAVDAAVVTGERLEVTDHLPQGFAPRDATWNAIASGDLRHLTRAVVPTRRGRFLPEVPSAVVTGRLGLAWAPVRGESASDLTVLPDLQPLGRYDALARQARLREMGIVRARARGEGHDFASLRAYTPGDPFQRIHWKATARRGKPIVREHEAERQQPVVLLLDCGRRMARETPGPAGVRSRLDEAVDAALLLGHVALAADDRVGLWAFADAPLRRLAPARGALQEKRLARAVFDLEPVLREPHYAGIAARVAAAETRRSLLVLFTDVIDPGSLAQLAGPLRLLRRRHLCLLVVFQDPALTAAQRVPPVDSESLYLAGAAASLARERETGLAALRQAGALVLEAPPGGLSSAVVNRYLEIKARGLL